MWLNINLRHLCQLHSNFNGLQTLCKPVVNGLHIKNHLVEVLWSGAAGSMGLAFGAGGGTGGGGVDVDNGVGGVGAVGGRSWRSCCCRCSWRRWESSIICCWAWIIRTDSASCWVVEPNVAKSCCTEGEADGAEGASIVVVDGAVGVERRGFSAFFSERTFGAAFTAVCRGVVEGGVDVVVATGWGWWTRSGWGEHGNGVGGTDGSWTGAGAVGHAVENAGPVGAAKVGATEWKVVESELVVGGVEGTRCWAGIGCEEVASEVNDGDGVEWVVEGNEVVEAHEGCNVEGCPNKCSTGVVAVPGIRVGPIEYWCGSIGYPGWGAEWEDGDVVGQVIGGLEVDAIDGGCGGHVDDVGVGCGEVGHDVGGVVHGNIARIKWEMVK